MLPLSPISPTVFLAGNLVATQGKAIGKQRKDNLEFPNRENKSRMKQVSVSLLFAMSGIVDFVLKIAKEQRLPSC